MNAELNGKTVRELAVDAASYETKDWFSLNAPASLKALSDAGIPLMPTFDDSDDETFFAISVCCPKRDIPWQPDLKTAITVLREYCWGVYLDGTPYDVFAEREPAKPVAAEAAKPTPTPKVVALPKPARTRPARNAAAETMTPEEACQLVWNAQYKGRTVGQWATSLWHITEDDVMAGKLNEHEGRKETEALGLMLVMDSRSTHYVFIVRPDRLFKLLPELKPCADALKLCEGIGIGGAAYRIGDEFAPDPVLHSPKPRLTVVK